MITLTGIKETIKEVLKDISDADLEQLAQHLIQDINKIIPTATVHIEAITLDIKTVEDILEAIKRVKDIHSSIEPRYVEDTLYVDQLKQLEFKLEEKLFNSN